MLCPPRIRDEKIAANTIQCGAQPTSAGERQEVEEVFNPVKRLNYPRPSKEKHSNSPPIFLNFQSSPFLRDSTPPRILPETDLLSSLSFSLSIFSSLSSICVAFPVLFLCVRHEKKIGADTGVICFLVMRRSLEFCCVFSFSFRKQRERGVCVRWGRGYPV